MQDHRDLNFLIKKQIQHSKYSAALYKGIAQNFQNSHLRIISGFQWFSRRSTEEEAITTMLRAMNITEENTTSTDNEMLGGVNFQNPLEAFESTKRREEESLSRLVSINSLSITERSATESFIDDKKAFIRDLSKIIDLLKSPLNFSSYNQVDKPKIESPRTTNDNVTTRNEDTKEKDEPTSIANANSTETSSAKAHYCPGVSSFPACVLQFQFGVEGFSRIQDLSFCSDERHKRALRVVQASPSNKSHRATESVAQQMKTSISRTYGRVICVRPRRENYYIEFASEKAAKKLLAKRKMHSNGLKFFLNKNHRYSFEEQGIQKHGTNARI